jgi:hypothetical protein
MPNLRYPFASTAAAFVAMDKFLLTPVLNASKPISQVKFILPQCMLQRAEVIVYWFYYTWRTKRFQVTKHYFCDTIHKLSPSFFVDNVKIIFSMWIFVVQYVNIILQIKNVAFYNKGATGHV